MFDYLVFFFFLLRGLNKYYITKNTISHKMFIYFYFNYVVRRGVDMKTPW